MSDRQPRASGYFRTNYRQDLKLIHTTMQRASLAAFLCLVVGFPFVASSFHVDLACQVFLASIGSLSLMLLSGYAGQISLGHAGLLAAGAYTTGILFAEFNTGFWVTLPCSALVGALLGVVFGLPSLRLRGLYLAVSTLALHFVVAYFGSEYESARGLLTGIVIDPPKVAGLTIESGRQWYFILLTAAAATLLISLNLLRSRIGRSWRALSSREIVAEALGIDVARAKLLAFVITSSITAVSGCLFAYYRGFVSVEAFSLFLTIQYFAMIIVGGMGSVSGALLGAAFVTLMPYGIEATVRSFPGAKHFADLLFAVNYAAFGGVMIVFLMFEPLGLVGIWHRVQRYFLLWPFRYQPLRPRK